MNELTQLISDLVAIESVNPDLAPGGSGEANIARFVADWLAKAGVEVEMDEPAPGRPNVIGTVRGSGGGKTLMLNAHMDTVSVEGMDAPFTPRVAEGKLYGRGAYDMKASLAACMLAARAATAMKLAGDLIFTAVADEEYASIGTASIAQNPRWRADAAIITEPTHLDLCVAHRGFIWLEVETSGVAAHGSRPELGVDAIVKMGHVLVALEELNRTLRANPTHTLLHSGSLHASLISGGRELSSYPDRCVLAVERRTIPSETPEVVEGQIQQILDRIGAADPTFKAAVRTTLVRDAFESPADAPIVQAVQAQIERQLQRTPRVYGDTPWMDSALLSAVGIPCVIFGPAGAGAHALTEWVDLASVQKCVDILSGVMRDFCGSSY